MNAPLVYAYICFYALAQIGKKWISQNDIRCIHPNSSDVLNLELVYVYVN